MRPSFALLLLLGCGGVGTEAPRIERASGCPTADEAMSQTKTFLHEETSTVGREILLDQGGIRVLLPAIRKAVAAVAEDDLTHLADGLGDGQGLASLGPHAEQALEYFVGDSAILTGPHYEPILAIQRTMTKCDVVRTLPALRQIFETTAGGEQKFLSALVEVLVELSDDQVFLTLLQSFEISDEQSAGSVQIGKDAFAVLARLLSGTISAPGFEFATLRELLNDTILAQLPPEAEATRTRIDRLLDLFALVLDPQQPFFEDTQVLFQCLSDVDPNAEIPGMFFDYLSTDDVGLPGVLSDLQRFGDSAAGEASGRIFVATALAFDGEANLLRDATVVVARFIDEDNIDKTLPLLLRASQSGIFTEFIELFDRITLGCR